MNEPFYPEARPTVQVKYVCDRLLSGLAILVLSPLYVLIGILIKLEDGGSMLFRQERLGVNGEIFRVFKFRSMVVNADKLLNADGSVDANVSRITRVGRILRKTSLDELPQLVNIFRGEMSIVGPRPTLPSHWNRYSDTQRKRAGMRPGVTGWAQVHGRNTLPWTKRIEYDVEYIESYSWWLDIKILFMTVRQVLGGEGIVMDRNPGQVDDLPLSREDVVKEPENGPTPSPS